MVGNGGLTCEIMLRRITCDVKAWRDGHLRGRVERGRDI